MDRGEKIEEKKENEKIGRKKEREEGRYDSFFLLDLIFRLLEFVRPRVKAGYAPRGWDVFPTLVNFYLSAM